MVKILDRMELESRLDGKSAQFLVDVSSRAGFRAFPIMGLRSIELTSFTNWRNEFCVPAFRSLITSKRYGVPRYHAAQLLKDATNFARSSTKITRNIQKNPGKIRSLLSLFLHGENGNNRIGDNRIYLALAKANFSELLDDIAYNSLLSAIYLDITALESGINLWTQPLWLDDTPEWAIRGWEALATELTKQAPYWRTLVRWYEDGLHGDDWAASQGRPMIPQLEIARASLPDSYWKKGGKAVNLAIAELEAFFWEDKPLQDPVLRELVGQMGIITANSNEADDSTSEQVPDVFPASDRFDESELFTLLADNAIPEQVPTAIQFASQPGGPIDLASLTLDDRLLDDPDRREDFAELRHKAEDLASEGINRLGRLGVPLDRFLNLSDDLTGIRGKLLWSRINTFRIVLQGHSAAMKIAEQGGERDERQLDGVVADKLVDLVETINLFVLGDPTLLELDARRAGPQELAAAKTQISAIKPVLNLGAVNPAVVTEIAADILVEQAINVSVAEDTLAGRQAAELGAKTTRNFIGTLLRRAYRVIRAELATLSKGAREGAYREIGKLLLDSGLANRSSIQIATLRFIAANADRLVIYARYAYDNVDIERIIHLIASLF